MEKNARIINLILLFLIGINVLYVFSGVIHYPLRSIDVYSIWMLKAKAFWIEGGFPHHLLSTANYSHPHYPILLSYIFYLLFKIFGQYNEIYVLLIYPLVYIAILLLSYISFRKIKISKTKSFISVYIYSMLSPLLAQSGRYHAGNADIIITMIYWIFVVAILNFLKTKKNIYLLIMLLFVFISSQIKQEGVFLTATFLFLPIDKYKKVFLIFLSLIPTFVWQIFLINNKIYGDYSLFYFHKDIFYELLKIIVYSIKEMINIRNWYIFWIMFFLTSLLIKIKDHKIIIINKILLTVVGCFVFVYLTTSLDSVKQLSSSLDRILLQMSPFIYLIFVYKFWGIFNGNRILWDTKKN